MHRSERHHALLESVDVSAALAVKGVVKVLTHADVPNNWYTILKLINVGYDDEPVLAEDKVLYLRRADRRRRGHVRAGRARRRRRRAR